MQSKHDEIEAKFFEERAALEAKYQKLYEPLYAKVHFLIMFFYFELFMLIFERSDFYLLSFNALLKLTHLMFFRDMILSMELWRLMVPVTSQPVKMLPREKKQVV